MNISKFFHNSGTLGTFTSSRSSQNEYDIRFGHFNTVKTIEISPRWFLNTTFECSSYDFRQRQQHVKWEADVDSRDFSTSEFHAGAFAHEISECRFHVKMMIRKSTEIIFKRNWMNELLQQKRQIVVCLFTFLFAVVSPGGGSVVEMGGRKQENGITREIQNVLHPNYYIVKYVPSQLNSNFQSQTFRNQFCGALE